MQTIYLDISYKGVVPTIYAKQGDVGRMFEVVLTDSGLPYVPDSGSVFSVWYSGTSGEGNYTDIGEKSAFSVSGNKVAVEMIAQMLSNYGDGILSLALNDPNGNQISTWNIPYICESVPGVDSEAAKEYYTAFSMAIESLMYPDSSLSVHGKAADAAATGEAIKSNTDKIDSLTAEDVGARPDTWLPTPDDIGAINAASVNLANMSVKEWAQASKLSAYAYADSTTKDMPTDVDPSESFAIVTATVSGGGSWIELKLNYVLTGCVAVAIYNYGWNEWKWENPPMTTGIEYLTTERYNGKALYTKAMEFAPAYPSASVGFGGDVELIRAELRVNSTLLPHYESNGALTRWAQTSNVGISVFVAGEAYATGTIYAQVWYTKD